MPCSHSSIHSQASPADVVLTSCVMPGRGGRAGGRATSAPAASSAPCRRSCKPFRTQAAACLAASQRQQAPAPAQQQAPAAPGAIHGSTRPAAPRASTSPAAGTSSTKHSGHAQCPAWAARSPWPACPAPPRPPAPPASAPPASSAPAAGCTPPRSRPACSRRWRAGQGARGVAGMRWNSREQRVPRVGTKGTRALCSRPPPRCGRPQAAGPSCSCCQAAAAA